VIGHSKINENTHFHLNEMIVVKPLKKGKEELGFLPHLGASKEKS